MTRARRSNGANGKGADPLFLRNQWYVAAWSDEVTRQPLARVLLGDYLVLYRAEDGSPIALENRCPHRNLPLSEGTLIGDSLECSYHGMVFGPDGRCSHLPGAETPPDWACVRAYPAIERHGWVLVWMGDAQAADPALAPGHHVRLDDPDWLTIKGYCDARCGYRLILDNLLDLSHLAYVHASTTGNRELAEQATISAETEGDRVRVTRWMSDVPPAPALIDYAGYAQPIDRWQYSEFIPPSYIYVNNGTEAAGAGVSAEARRASQGKWGFVVYHALTPASDRSTHQFWAMCIPRAFVPEDKLETFEAQMRHIPIEDLVVYEAQQKAIDLDPDANGDVRPLGMIDADQGLFAMRKILQRLHAAERRAGR